MDMRENALYFEYQFQRFLSTFVLDRLGYEAHEYQSHSDGKQFLLVPLNEVLLTGGGGGCLDGVACEIGSCPTPLDDPGGLRRGEYRPLVPGGTLGLLLVSHGLGGADIISRSEKLVLQVPSCNRPGL